VQELFIGMMIAEPQLFTRVSNIMSQENFSKSLRRAAEFIVEFSDENRSLPDLQIIKATTGINIAPVERVDQHHVEWFLSEFEKFTRRQELERAIMKSADLLEKGDYDPVEKLIKDAVQISLTKNLGTDYFADPKQRLLSIKDNNGQISTGWPSLDTKLYGGMNRGELNIFAGGSGSGKSLFMQNLAVNWVMGRDRDGTRLNGVYISLELSEALCAWRIDSMVTDTAAKQVFKEIDDVALKVGIASKKAGKLFIKYLPAQSNVNDIRAYIKSLEIETGLSIDFMCVDYLDLLMPVSAKVSPSDLFIKDKYVSEELRNLAKELNVLLVTASQLNRAAVDEITFDHSHISGGISKINTADNVFGIFTSRAMRERGEYQIQLMKTRSSSGVGTHVDLRFNADSLRIFDDGDSTGTAAANQVATSVIDRIRGTSTVNSKPESPKFSPVVDADTGEYKPDSEPTGKIVPNYQSTALRNIMNNVRRGNLGDNNSDN
jgi:RecA/RadA recombinase